MIVVNFLFTEEESSKLFKWDIFVLRYTKVKHFSFFPNLLDCSSFFDHQLLHHYQHLHEKLVLSSCWYYFGHMMMMMMFAVAVETQIVSLVKTTMAIVTILAMNFEFCSFLFIFFRLLADSFGY